MWGSTHSAPVTSDSELLPSPHFLSQLLPGRRVGLTAESLPDQVQPVDYASYIGDAGVCLGEVPEEDSHCICLFSHRLWPKGLVELQYAVLVMKWLLQKLWPWKTCSFRPAS